MRRLCADHPAALKGILRAVLLLGTAALAISCGKNSTFSQPIRDPDGLVRDLRAAGANLEAAAWNAPFVDLPDPQLYQLDGEMVQIGAAELEEIDLQMMVSSQAGLRVWFGSGWYLAYAGRDGGVILLLSGLLGDPIQAEPINLEEPFPPAVPSAMRKLADELGVSPSDFTVLDFQPVVWQDSCLGIESQAADCTRGETSGWVLTLLIDGLKYELHSDEAGEIVRWGVPIPFAGE